MVFKEETYTSWLWPLFQSPSAEKRALGRDVESADGKRETDIVDAMEMGFAREFAADFVRPLRQSSRLWKFHVKRSIDRQHYRLFRDDGEFLVYANLSKEGRHINFFLYDPLQKHSSLFDPNRPAFTMSFNQSKTEWRLVQEHDDSCKFSYRQSGCRCRGKQELCCIRHARQIVGDGTCNCMEMVIPMDEVDPQMIRRLVTRLPVWNDEVESLVLDFGDREVQSSPKNFQLVLEEYPKLLVCQYCKIGANTFSLDFRYPLGVIQAFGASLATLYWT